jgi:hypothetical protein
MSFPDYGTAIEQVATWIAVGCNLASGRTMFLEPDLPPAPDCMEALFETGGQWIIERNIQDWRLLLVTRATTLREARGLAVASINAALTGFKTSARPLPGNIRALRLENLPRITGRDERKRIILETTFILSVNAEDETGK